MGCSIGAQRDVPAEIRAARRRLPAGSAQAAYQLLADIDTARIRRDAALAAGDDAEVRRLEEQEKAQWRVWGERLGWPAEPRQLPPMTPGPATVMEVVEAAEATLKREAAALAASDDAEVRRLEDEFMALWDRLFEIRAREDEANTA